ncbi:hypothetical protein D3C78_1546060 [compost metagenome]
MSYPHKIKPQHYTPAELALAYELRGCGCSWKAITQGVGGREDTLKKAVRRAARQGLPA